MSTTETEIAAAWREAAKNLEIPVHTMGTGVDAEGHVIPYVVRIENFGSSNGVVCRYYKGDEEEIRRFEHWAKASGLYYSLLGGPYRQYDRELFIDTLNDWMWFGQEDPPPWYTGVSDWP